MDAHPGVLRRAHPIVGAAAASLLLSALLVALATTPASGASFSNTANITIPSLGAATPYPSTISVSGLPGAIADVNVALTGFSHSYVGDVDILLAGPGGQSVVLLADACGATSFSGVALTFDQAAAATLPASGCTAGTYRPTNSGSFNGVAPAPAGPYGSSLATFNGTSANGTWSLFVYDDLGAFSGGISGGWTLNITTVPTISSFTPTQGKVGASVVITGTEFTGATSVTFDGVAATTFTVDSATQITATVPAAATTGPIAITTPAGTGTSTSDFVVKHARTVTLNLTARKAKGAVSADDGYAACASGVVVKVQRQVGSKWRTVGTDTTSTTGAYNVGGATQDGKYRTVAKKVTLASGDVCLKAKSPIVRK